MQHDSDWFFKNMFSVLFFREKRPSLYEISFCLKGSAFEINPSLWHNQPTWQLQIMVI